MWHRCINVGQTIDVLVSGLIPLMVLIYAALHRSFCVILCRAQILVLLDVTPDQSMLDEGLAREVINRIQKLRQKVRKKNL